MTAQPNSQIDAVQTLREEFRRHLEVFYAQMKLAPPYHSLEKAIALLVTRVKAMDVTGQMRLLSDQTLRWAEYSQAFADSGLNRKHRGIIARMRQGPLPPGFPQEYEHFLRTFST